MAYFHSREPSFHSWYSPAIRTMANKVIIDLVSRRRKLIEGIGIKSAISISNTKKSTARIKNRREKGIRAELCGSNPHSNGVAFSKFVVAFLFNRNVAATMRIGKNTAVAIAIKIMVIFLGKKDPVNEVKIHCYCKLLRINLNKGTGRYWRKILMINVIKVIRSFRRSIILIEQKRL